VRRRRLWQAGAVALAGALTVALTQNTTTAAFTAQTVDTGNAVTAKTDFCTAPGRLDTLPSPTYPTVVDTGLYESQPATNFSTNVQIGVVAPAAGRARSLIKFTLPPKPAGCVVASAVLKLRVANGAAGASVIVFRAAATWNPTGVTWSTDPGYVAGSGTPTTTTASTTVTPFSVTTQVRALYVGPDYGFELVDAAEGVGTGASLYDSMEVTTVANRPKLEITWG
jgi:hypothetical protein